MAEINHRKTNHVLLHKRRRNRDLQIPILFTTLTNTSGTRQGSTVGTKLLGQESLAGEGKKTPSDTSNKLESLRLFTFFLEVTQSLSPLVC